uniref:Uncharacterized protein n=1 Tax=Anguilla anguilla TaxID=7936 RepID=A0A0E9U0T8_ANGAN
MLLFKINYFSNVTALFNPLKMFLVLNTSWSMIVIGLNN